MSMTMELTAGTFRAAHDAAHDAAQKWVAGGAGMDAGKQRLIASARNAVDTTPGSPAWRPPA